MQPTILVVDDEKNTREGLVRALRRDYEVFAAESAASALEVLAARAVDLMLSDVRMPDMDGIALLKETRARHPGTVCILLTAYGSVETAVEAMKLGAADFIAKPVNLDHLDLAIAKALENKDRESDATPSKRAASAKSGLGEILGDSPAMTKLFDLIRQVAPTQATVLIEGASGTGKELVARSLHSLSRRADGPFVAVHCAALSPSLLESELFGHEKGAFTGAAERRVGRFEAANHGTLFLDEISEIDASTQVKLLRVLQERKFERVGGTENVDVDIRVIAATNRDLRRFVADGKFREDLYYRLDVVGISMPPLKDRGNDVITLTRHFIDEFAELNGRAVIGISPAAAAALQAYAWPGNVRELRNTVEKMVVLARGAELAIDDVPVNIKAGGMAEAASPPSSPPAILASAPSSAAPAVFSDSIPPSAPVEAASPASAAVGAESSAEPRKTLEELADEKMVEAVYAARGNITDAARQLGISRRTIHRRVEKSAALKEAVETATARRRGSVL